MNRAASFSPSAHRDHENGLRLERARCQQLFVPIADGRRWLPGVFSAGVFGAVPAVVTGSPQSRQRHGWKGAWSSGTGSGGTCVGWEPASLLANVITAYGCLTWLGSRWGGGWGWLRRQTPGCWHYCRRSRRRRARLDWRPVATLQRESTDGVCGSPGAVHCREPVELMALWLRCAVFGERWYHTPLVWVNRARLSQYGQPDG